MHGQRVGRNRSQGHRREVLERIVRDLRIEAWIDDVARGHEHDGVTVRRGACGVTHADIAASANLVLDVELLSEVLGEFLHQQTREYVGRTGRRERYDDAHRVRRIGLRKRRNRPRGSRAAEKRDELAALHSITSSARGTSDGGRSRPSALAVLRLMTNSNLVACMTSRSAGPWVVA